MATIQDYRNEQLEKLEALKAKRINPYPATSRRTVSVEDILGNFDVREGNQVVVAGRVVSVRTHGRLNFIDLQDGLHKIQLVFKDGEVVENYEDGKLAFSDINLLARGDFIEAAGAVGKSKTGQESVMVAWYAVLSKVLRPLPDELVDKEARFRRRYLDMAVNKEVRERFLRRSKFWQATRNYLNKRQFVEVNIPVLEHTTGGADAKPFVTHMDALDQDYFLRISHELPLKRLLGAGFERVYDIGPRFRNEHISDEHLPEHIAMESYAAYQNYEEAMDFYEKMIQYVAQETWGTLQFDDANGFAVDLSGKWPVRSYADVLQEEFNVDVFNPDRQQLLKILKDNNVELESDEVSVGRLIDNVWKIIRRKSAGPYWLVHEPASMSPLAKTDPADPRLALRFHPIIAGSELGNGFAELNDPQEQLARFKEQQAMRDGGDDEAQMLDIDYVEMLEYGMPTACGWGNSERNFWLLEGVTAREGVPFPHMRFEIDDNTKEIYDLNNSKNNRDRKQDFSKRVVIVVDKQLENWQIANAVGHTSAYLGNQLSKEDFDTADYFITKDSAELPRNSQYPIIIKRAASKDLKKLYIKLQSSHLKHHVFIKEMIDTTDDTEIVEKLSKKTREDLVIYGIGVFGPNGDVNELTKNFQLWT